MSLSIILYFKMQWVWQFFKSMSWGSDQTCMIRIRISDPRSLGSRWSKEPMNPCPEWIHRFIWSTMIRVISDHWSWSGSSQRNAPVVHHEADHWSRWISHLDNSNGYPVCLLSPFLFCFIDWENIVSLYPKNIGKTFCYVKLVQALSRWTQKTNWLCV